MDHDEQIEAMCKIAVRMDNAKLLKELSFAEGFTDPYSGDADDEEEDLLWLRVLRAEKKIRGL